MKNLTWIQEILDSVEPRSHLRCLLKVQTPRLHVHKESSLQCLWAGPSRAEASCPSAHCSDSPLRLAPGLSGGSGTACGGPCCLKWWLGCLQPQHCRPQGHLHTRWLLLLHQKPAGSMEAELTVGSWAVIKMGHHSCSHGRVCWGERRHLAQIQGTTRHPTVPTPWRRSPDGWGV